MNKININDRRGAKQRELKELLKVNELDKKALKDKEGGVNIKSLGLGIGPVIPHTH